jgi:hypothetical protein
MTVRTLGLGLLGTAVVVIAGAALVLLATGFGEASSNEETIGIPRISCRWWSASQPVTITLQNDDPIGHDGRRRGRCTSGTD